MKVKLSLILGALLLTTLVGHAQDYDDIYYNPSKPTQKVDKKKDKNIEDDNVFNSYDLPYNIGDLRDIDEYNRRYTYVDTLGTDTMSLSAQGDFVYTDRIRRFHNPSVVAESDIPEINIIIGTPTSYYNPFMYDWGMPSYWNYGWYSPRIYSAWHYDWYWGFGWDWYYPMFPYHHHHYHHHHGWYPGHIHGPVVGGGGIASGGSNHRPTYNAGGRRPFGVNTTNEGVGRRPSSTSGRGNSSVKSDNRKSSSKRSSSSSNSGGRRPSMSSNNDYRNSSSSSYNNSVRSSRSSSDKFDRGSNSSYGGGGSNRGGSSRGGRR